MDIKHSSSRLDVVYLGAEYSIILIDIHYEYSISCDLPAPLSSYTTRIRISSTPLFLKLYHCPLIC